MMAILFAHTIFAIFYEKHAIAYFYKNMPDKAEALLGKRGGIFFDIKKQISLKSHIGLLDWGNKVEEKKAKRKFYLILTLRKTQIIITMTTIVSVAASIYIENS